jgi:hypothetical protein
MPNLNFAGALVAMIKFGSVFLVEQEGTLKFCTFDNLAA